MNYTLSLYRLQQIDIQIDQIKTHLETIQKTLDNNDALRMLQERITAVEDQREQVEQALVHDEELVRNQHIKIEQTQSSLYGAKSHTPKELLDLQQDWAALKRHLITLEDHQIETMIAFETSEIDLQTLKTKFMGLAKFRDEQCKTLLKEQEVYNTDLDKLSIKRNSVSGVIPVAELNLYDQLREQRRGIAVSVIEDKSCSACGSSISLAQIQSARSSGRMEFCPSCGRILYGS